jgi:hypothetical protein
VPPPTLRHTRPDANANASQHQGHERRVQQPLASHRVPVVPAAGDGVPNLLAPLGCRRRCCCGCCGALAAAGPRRVPATAATALRRRQRPRLLLLLLPAGRQARCGCCRWRGALGRGRGLLVCMPLLDACSTARAPAGRGRVVSIRVAVGMAHACVCACVCCVCCVPPQGDSKRASRAHRSWLSSTRAPTRTKE